MSEQEVETFTYFQYASELDLPVFLGVHLADFDSSLTGFLTQMGFSLMTQNDPDALGKRLKTEPSARVLMLEPAGVRATGQIQRKVESDNYGAESLVPNEGYRVYRYKGLALMLMSYGVTEWKLGVVPEFGQEEVLTSSRCVLNRFLSWALAPLGIAGFWAVPVEHGVVIAKQGETQGEAVFFDLMRSRLLTCEGAKTFKSGFRIIRLDPFLKEEWRKISADELVGFLSVHSSYFSLEGLSIPVRQVIQTMARQFEGHRCPQSSFQSRTAEENRLR